MIMFIRKVTALALASIMLANCATAPGEESYCSRNTALCILGGAAVVAVVVLAVAVASVDNNGGYWSDLRLKEDVRPVGALPNGLQLYSFRYRNDDRTFVSVMAQDLLEDERFRHAVTEDESGYYMVNLGALGLDVSGSRSQFFEAGQKAVAEAEPVIN
jgi:hypothetical protein